MPIVRIDLWKGKGREGKKAELIEKLTSAVVEVVGCPPEAVAVIINWVDKENWGMAGEAASVKAPDI
jgi:4-oxalocrotonate tautomerase